MEVLVHNVSRSYFLYRFVPVSHYTPNEIINALLLVFERFVFIQRGLIAELTEENLCCVCFGGFF